MFAVNSGLPQPQEDHAILMAKFAQSCIVKLHIVTADLVRTLGEDTAMLDIRVGLHRYDLIKECLLGGFP